MARVQVYLPDDLHAKAKAKRLPVSRLLEDAIRAALRRETLQAEMTRYVTELQTEVGEPGVAEKAKAAAWAKRVLRGGQKRAA